MHRACPGVRSLSLGADTNQAQEKAPDPSAPSPSANAARGRRICGRCPVVTSGAAHASAAKPRPRPLVLDPDGAIGRMTPRRQPVRRPRAASSRSMRSLPKNSFPSRMKLGTPKTPQAIRVVRVRDDSGLVALVGDDVRDGARSESSLVRHRLQHREVGDVPLLGPVASHDRPHEGVGAAPLGRVDAGSKGSRGPKRIVRVRIVVQAVLRHAVGEVVPVPRGPGGALVQRTHASNPVHQVGQVDGPPEDRHAVVQCERTDQGRGEIGPGTVDVEEEGHRRPVPRSRRGGRGRVHRAVR